MNVYQNLINDCLIDTNHVESAAMIVTKTGRITAVSSRFQISPEEAQAFVDLFKHLKSTRERGCHFQEKAYICVRADRNSIYSKCDGHGLVLVKTGVFVIVATYNERMYPSVCVEAAEQFARYLREKGK